MLNEHDFSLLSNAYQSNLSNVSGSVTRLYQCNMKHVSVHVSPAYPSSVSELVKLLSVSKPVCSSNATKRNVCNASSVNSLND